MSHSRYWREEAACRLLDSRLFDEVDHQRDGVLRRVKTAQAICAGCPVTEPCLREARRDKDSGVRGGILLEHGTPREMPTDRPYRQRAPKSAVPRRSPEEVVASRREKARQYRARQRAALAALRAARGPYWRPHAADGAA